MVETHPVSGPCTAIVGCDEKRLMPQMVHHLDLVLRHRPKGIVLMPWTALRLALVTVASKVRQHQCVPLGKPIGDFVPYEMRLKIPMQKKQWRPGTPNEGMNRRRSRCYVFDFETLK